MDRKCAKCEKTYSTEGNLRKHIRTKHPNDQSIIPRKYKEEGNFQYNCTCGKNFNHKHHFIYHVKSHGCDVINPVLTPMRVLKKCPICPYSDFYINNLMKHFEGNHNIVIQEQLLQFSSEDLFDGWKSETEKKTISSFVKNYSKKSSLGITTKFICNRSGNYVPKNTKRLRILKTQGTNKINAFCPASMKLVVDNEGKCSVKYIETHIGHINELGHVFLSPVERAQIAEKIALKIPFEEILNEVRDSVTNSSLNRSHLLTRKDLYNIENSFKLQTDSIRNSNDCVSVKAWIHEFIEKDDIYVFYKSQGMYGSDVICIDATHGAKNCNLELITLLVLDNMRQGFPCAFCITNRTDKEALHIFFSYIQNWTGKICPNIFMSDMSDAFYNAWLEVMEKPRLRLYCTWHVDRAWRENLNKIRNKNIRVLIYKKLRSLLEEKDQVAFLGMLNGFYQQISTERDTEKFGKYFLNYMKNYELWASCHRLYTVVNSNMHLECMHEVFKNIYLKGKTVRTLDKVISALMKFIKDKLFDRLITINKGKITSKLKDIKSRHKTSLALDVSLLITSDEDWTFKSSSSKVYFINEVDTDCNCQLRCNYCDACIHRYSCTCMDSAIKWIMCKHIHLVCMFRAQTTKQQSLLINDNDDLAGELVQNNELQMDVNPITGTALTQQKQSQEQIETKQSQKMKNSFLTILEKTNTLAELDILKKKAAPIGPTVAAVKSLTTSPQIERSQVKSRSPLNKHVSQRKHLSTKKERLANAEKLTKPSASESQQSAIYYVVTIN
ncbi:uncharacterized protein LOC109543670 isoform X1 [Dendroctonus ponderosae]|uniref:uncharacterized protein LOC109543670 isoform X1 n=1 Tax=Dendroctonus ponderosae TaxID=77166 RepID=UPI0020361C3A|nr:uncharacterized protein LOC109543670 isoform X1 [Dendroctonus ponderosae]